ncbi:NUDIX domain-containing protein [Amycolatopsis sp. PS_44_ISF1]|uniref:NUDIX hydrolase n=1 Tax=Amycolatopsis sp. PS_44_ISF1 TaxID=2974917 RepID=UPI0028DD6624|nr:NUDIX domain-containing protein [Amycolatopsis sp. PS_44_ISF1]MDT8911368.1 NUDIX domain-containing protein [Amycolatopsis sp. PS_44_ISF1]
MIDKIAWLHLAGGRVLGARSKGKDTWYFPGGKREPGESDVETLVREISEELTVALVPASIAPAGAWEAQADGRADGTVVRMTCYTAEHTGTLAPNSEIAELAWLGYADRPRVSAVCRLIFDDLRSQGRLD